MRSSTGLLCISCMTVYILAQKFLVLNFFFSSIKRKRRKRWPRRLCPFPKDSRNSEAPQESWDILEPQDLTHHLRKVSCEGY